MPGEFVSTTELIDRARAIDRRLGELEFLLARSSNKLSRTLKLSFGSAATLLGIVFAPPTGGLTAVAAGIGLVLCADGVREDALMDNERRAAAVEYERLRLTLDAIDLELRSRGL